MIKKLILTGLEKKNQISKIMPAKTLIIFVALAIMSVTTLASCSGSARNLRNAKKNITISHNATSLIDEACLNDITIFRQEIVVQFAKNDSFMQMHKEELREEYKETNPYYKNEIAKLEEKQLDLKIRLDNYVTNGSENWSIFKAQFTTEMFELNNSYEELRVKPAIHNKI